MRLPVDNVVAFDSNDKASRAFEAGQIVHLNNHSQEAMSFDQLTVLSDVTLRDRVVTSLRDLITSGQLKPGTRLVETDLASRLGVSRGPLREALRDLVQEGLIESVPYKGMTVAPTRLEDLRELLSLRATLEQFAFRLVWKQRSDESLADLSERQRILQSAITAGDQGKILAAHLTLHDWVFEESGHSLLLSNWQGLQSRLQFYLAFISGAAAGEAGQIDSHETYLDLASGSSLIALVRHLEDHGEGAEQRLSDILDGSAG